MLDHKQIVLVSMMPPMLVIPSVSTISVPVMIVDRMPVIVMMIMVSYP